MTDDQTRLNETPVAPPAPPAEAAPAASGPGATSASQVPPVASSGGPGRGRLLAGLGIAGVVLAVTAGAVLLLGGSTTPEALRYIPGDAALVMEVRMDLPGDQMQKLGNALQHFPGFADTSTLSQKIDEAFGQLVSSVSDGEADYVTDIKPWLNGPLFVATDAATLAEASADGDAPSERFVMAATTNGGVACSTAFEGQPTTTETYRGLELTIASEGAMACVVDGRFGVLGDTAWVKKALDTKADGTGIDKSTAYTAARRTLTGEQLGTVWFSGDAFRAAAPSAMPSLPIPGMDVFQAIPDWFIVGLRAEDDAFVVDAAIAPVEPPSSAASLLTLPPGHASNLARLVPADTLVYVEDQGTGINLRNLLATLRTVPELEQALQMLEGMAAPEELVGWIDEAAIALSADGTTSEDLAPRVTVLLAAADAATASEKAAGLRTLLSLAALGGQGIEVSTTTIVGHEVTTVTISDLGSLVPPGSIPDLGEVPAEDISFSLAVIDRVIYLVVGEGVEEVISLPSGAGLADSDAFKQAGARGLQNSRATMYVAVGSTVDLVESLAAEMLGPEWSTDIKPYLDPVQAVGGWTTSDASGTRFRAVLTVGQP